MTETNSSEVVVFQKGCKCFMRNLLKSFKQMGEYASIRQMRFSLSIGILFLFPFPLFLRVISLLLFWLSSKSCAGAPFC